MEVKVKTKLGRCPFCGEELVADDISLMWVRILGKWMFTHYCCHDKHNAHRVEIVVSGNTREEVIERCRASLKK